MKVGFEVKAATKFSKFVNWLSTWSGKAAAWLMLPLVFELVYDTVFRYCFNAPTIWSYDVSYMLSGVLFMVGGAYTLQEEGYIRIEIFYQKFTKKEKTSVYKWVKKQDI